MKVEDWEKLLKNQLYKIWNEAYFKGVKDGRCNGYAGGYEYGAKETWDCARELIHIWYNHFHCDANRFNQVFKLDGKLSDDVFELFFNKYSSEMARDVIEEYKENEVKEE